MEHAIQVLQNEIKELECTLAICTHSEAMQKRIRGKIYGLHVAIMTLKKAD